LILSGDDRLGEQRFGGDCAGAAGYFEKTDRMIFRRNESRFIFQE